MYTFYLFDTHIIIELFSLPPQSKLLLDELKIEVHDMDLPTIKENFVYSLDPYIVHSHTAEAVNVGDWTGFRVLYNQPAFKKL